MHVVPDSKNKALRTLLLGGVLPVVAFTIIEETAGILWGLVAGMGFGVAEIIWEWRSRHRVETMTWASN